MTCSKIPRIRKKMNRFLSISRDYWFYLKKFFRIRILEISRKFSRHCSPTLGQVDWFSWTETCPLSQPVPPNLKNPLSQSHPVPPNMETPLPLSHLSHVIQPIPTCPIWLYHLSFPNFSQIFLGFLIVIPFFKKTLLTEKLQSSIMFEKVNNKQISTKILKTTVTIHSNTWVYFVQSLIRLHCDINTLNKLCLKVLYTCGVWLVDKQNYCKL